MNVIMGAGMDSLVVDVVERNVISCFALNNSNLAIVEVLYTDAMSLDAHVT